MTIFRVILALLLSVIVMILIMQCQGEWEHINQWAAVKPVEEAIKPSPNLLQVEQPEKDIFEIDKRRSRKFNFWKFKNNSAICDIRITVIDTNSISTDVVYDRDGEEAAAQDIARYIKKIWKYKRYKRGEYVIKVNTYYQFFDVVDASGLYLIKEYEGSDIRNGDLYFK